MLFPEASHAPPSEAPLRLPVNMDPTVYAVLNACRNQSFFAAAHFARSLDVTLCGLHEAEESEPSQLQADGSIRDSTYLSVAVEKQGESVAGSATEASQMDGSVEDPPLFIPLMDNESGGTLSSMMEDQAESSSSTSGLGYVSENPTKERSKQSTGLRSTHPSPPGGGERDGTLFPHFHGLWECGMFAGKRVHIETGDAYLGRGATAMVYEGWIVITDIVNGVETCLAKTPAAIKEITYNAKDKEVRNLYERALNLRFHMKHPGIVQSYYAGTYVPRFSCFRGSEKAMLFSHLVLARSVTGSVADVLKRTGPFPELEIRRCMAEMLSALECIHDVHHRVHNDVKPHNILIFDDATLYFSEVKYQITDLTGIAVAMPVEDVLRSIATGVVQRHSVASAGGTAMYMSPESCLGLGFMTSNDVWSLGITAYHMATGTLPWKPLERQFPSMILNGYRQKFTLQDLVGLQSNDPCETTGASPMSSTDSAVPEPGDEVGPRVRFQTESPAESQGPSDASGGCVAFRDQFKDFGPLLDVLNDVDASSDFRSFLKECLTENPLRRPTCRQLRDHPFVKDFKVEPHE
ncbi:protein kinase [Novymonas esmeraldas]|uniref:Protein kinase n=1 Tax=Novymonas esmeraldas TaxID=1808958 RepID=A0AAW0EJ69_9TRYP